jgi:hypothetical protein
MADSNLGKRDRAGRTLAVDPRIRRLGYAFFEGAMLHDWGVRNVRQDLPIVRVRRLLIPALVRMLDRFEPSVLLVPDVRSGAMRRSANVQTTIEGIVTEALNRGIVVCRVSDREIKIAFQKPTGRKRPNWQSMSEVITEWFPELLRHLPKERRLWEPERHFAPLFIAVAMFCTWRGVPAKRTGGGGDDRERVRADG